MDNHCSVTLLFISIQESNWVSLEKPDRTRKRPIKVARYSFSRSISPKFERKLCRHKQRFGKIDTTVVLDKDENLL